MSDALFSLAVILFVLGGLFSVLWKVYDLAVRLQAAERKRLSEGDL